MVDDPSVEMSRDALAFTAVVCTDQRQANHLMRLAASVSDGGCIQVARSQAEAMIDLAGAGLRAGGDGMRIVTPIRTIIREAEEGRFDLSDMGRTLLAEMAQ